MPQRAPATPVQLLTLLILSVVPGSVWAAPEGLEAELSVREADPMSLTLHSHPFLIGGLRLSHRVSDDRTEVGVLLGKAVVTGCAIQAPKCEQYSTVGVGVRRYLTSTRFTGYAGANLYYLAGGIRFTEESEIISDMNLGIHWQFWSGFTFGLGYAFFIHDEDGEGFDLAMQSWFSIEIGISF